MNKLTRLMLAAVAAVPLYACSAPEPSSLKVEMRTAPEGIDAPRPRFSWISPGTPESSRIKLYQSRKGKDGPWRRVWDSGNVGRGRSVLVSYTGPELAGNTDYCWKVRVKTADGRSRWSGKASFSTGIDSTGWGGAQWIGVDEQVGDNVQHLAARYLRKEFSLDRKPVSAKLYFCGLGMGAVTVNGSKVSPDIFAHPPVLFGKTVYYRTYDVTPLVRKGGNALGVVLGCGRYQTPSVWTLRCVTDPRMLLCLRLKYADGSEEAVVGDGSWSATVKGPVTCQNEFDGEHYDARLVMPGWDLPGYAEDSIWHPVSIMPDPKGRMQAMPMDDMAVQDFVRPVKITSFADGRAIVDMGVNMVGYARMSLEGFKDSTIVMRYAEHLNAAGDSLDMANLRDAEATDSYIPSQDGKFSWTPMFPYHGFRFIEIRGAAAAPEAEDIEGCVIYDKMETVGSFECSDSGLNALYSNIFRSVRSNYRGMPTDCPQRDERQGWLGDRGATVWGEPYIFDCASLYRKWMKDIADSMHKKGRISVVSPKNWTIYNDDTAASVVFLYAADMLYTRFGDISGIEEYYPAMCRWLRNITERNLHDGIFTMKHDEYRDWCVPPESPEIIHSKDPARITSSEVIHTAVYCDALRLMAKFAGLTGNSGDIPAYEKTLSEVREAYNARFFDPVKAVYDNGTPTSGLVALAMGMVPEGREKDVAASVVAAMDGHVASGNVGIRYMMQTLTHLGYKDLAYRLATQESYPGWGYMLAHGATTVWELWNGDTADAAMNSENHVMMIGDLLAWYYEDVAGIKCAPDAVAYDKVLMEPCFPDSLSWARASVRTPRGLLASSWAVGDAGYLSWKICIPAGTVAKVRVPSRFGADLSAFPAVADGDDYVFEIPSGEYEIN